MIAHVIVVYCALFSISQQAPSQEKCNCKMTYLDKVFPNDKLSMVAENATKCSLDTTPAKAVEIESLLLGLERRLLQFERDVSVLEREDDGDLYGVISLHLLEIDLLEIQQLINRLNTTTMAHRHLTNNAAELLENLKTEMQDLEMYDTMGVAKTRRENKLLMKALDKCRKTPQLSKQATSFPPAKCSFGWFKNVTEPRMYTEGEYPGLYKYGAWGRDPRPEPGKESWHWVVMLTSGNSYSNYVRRYSSLRDLIAGENVPGNVEISSLNPGTDTIQGPNVVMYGGALYYNCYNRPAVCRFNLTTKSVTSVQLPVGTRYNSKGDFCHLEDCHIFTDLDLATDESGVWVVYTTFQKKGNLVLSKMQEDEMPTLNQTWYTSVYKQEVTNTFVVCGVLYATRYIDKHLEEIFYSFDTATGIEKFNIGVVIKKMSPNIYSLNYSPVDQMLHAYCDSRLVSYKVVFRNYPF